MCRYREELVDGAYVKKPYGWVKGSGLLMDAVVSSAGHMVPMNQPLGAYDMISKFIRREKL